jgi:hypothetical protein
MLRRWHVFVYPTILSDRTRRGDDGVTPYQYASARGNGGNDATIALF